MASLISGNMQNIILGGRFRQSLSDPVPCGFLKLVTANHPNISFDNSTPPSGLQEWIRGGAYNQSLASVTFPIGFLRLVLAILVDHSLDNATLSRDLQGRIRTLLPLPMLGASNQCFTDVFLPIGFLKLVFAFFFNQRHHLNNVTFRSGPLHMMDNSTLPLGLMVLGNRSGGLSNLSSDIGTFPRDFDLQHWILGVAFNQSTANVTFPIGFLLSVSAIISDQSFDFRTGTILFMRTGIAPSGLP